MSAPQVPEEPGRVVGLPPDPGVEVIEVPPDAFDPMVGAEVIAVGLGNGDDLQGPAPRWWHGHGPPPEVIVGARPGDIYIDDDPDGDVYQLT